MKVLQQDWNVNVSLASIRMKMKKKRPSGSRKSELECPFTEKVKVHFVWKGAIKCTYR